MTYTLAIVGPNGEHISAPSFCLLNFPSKMERGSKADNSSKIQKDFLVKLLTFVLFRKSFLNKFVFIHTLSNGIKVNRYSSAKLVT